jgi:hypothetical protein
VQVPAVLTELRCAEPETPASNAVVRGIKRRAKSLAQMRGDGGIPTQDIETLSIGTNTHQGCTDFDLDAEIKVVWFREGLLACARSGG